MQVFTMNAVYFKTESGRHVRVLVRDGKIDYSALGDQFELDPTSIQLNESLCPREAVWEEIEDFFKKEGEPAGTKENPVIVTGKPRVHGASTGISLSERRKCEFDFSILKAWKSGEVLDTTVIADASENVLDTTEIADAMEKFGVFPRRYYVRLEERMVFQNCLNSLKKQSKLRALILGSPGVGKSVFLVLFAFYLAHVESKSVIILRKLKEVGQGAFACVHVSKKGSSGSRLDDLAAYPGIRSSLLSGDSNPEETLLFLDGFVQDDINNVNRHGILGGFNLLATSSQYSIKSDDGHTWGILLPAWRSEDLRLYAQCMGTFSSDESEPSEEALEQTPEEGTEKLSPEEKFEEKFQYAYSYSGGSLREFLRDDEERENIFRNAMSGISGDGVHALLSKYGARSNLQVDTIRKLYVTDTSNVKYYMTVSEYIPTVDSTVALGELRDRFSEEDFQTILTAGQSIGGAFLGLAFEWHIHKTASCDRGLTVEAWSDTDKSRRVKFKVGGGAAVQWGGTRKDCDDYLKRTWTQDVNSKYWFPKMPNYPNIDAIAKCQRQGDKVEECLVYFQIITRGSHDLDATKLNKLDAIFQGKFKERKYIALLPETARIEDFKITGDPDKSRVPLFIGKLCSDTRKLKRKSLQGLFKVLSG